MKGYAIDTAWDDPFEHPVERRTAPRFPIKLRLTLTAADLEKRAHVVGPGIVRNISLTGVLLVTKHVLHPFQRVRLELPTAILGEEVCLPESFEGTAQVMRTEPLDGGKSHVALRFGDDLSQNMEFVVFIDHLQTMARQRERSPRVA
jgi:hypothetical protein